MNLLVLNLLSQLMVVLLMLVLDLEQLLDQLNKQDLLLPLLMKQLALLLVYMLIGILQIASSLLKLGYVRVHHHLPKWLFHLLQYV